MQNKDFTVNKKEKSDLSKENIYGYIKKNIIQISIEIIYRNL